jgi:hypothetical protein
MGLSRDIPTEIIHDPVPSSVAQGIFYSNFLREILTEYIKFNREERGECVLSYCLGCSKVAQLLLYNADSLFVQCV